ncbi:MAG: CAP domain-containing protein [Halothece sp.]
MVILSGLGSCAATVSFPPAETNSPSPIAQTSPNVSLSNIEQSVLEQINQYRRSQDLAPLTPNPTLTQLAREHSEAMASGRVRFSHAGFQERAQVISQRIGYRRIAENVAYNYGNQDPATVAVEGWLKSPGHLQNIRGQFNLTGIGVAKNAKGEYYFTQLFVQSR